MAHLLSFNTPPPCPPPECPEPHSPPTRSINAASKAALLVESDEGLLNFLKRCLKDEGYAVRTASSSEEGLRLYRDCAPFNVVFIDYCVPERDGFGIDYLAQQTKGIELAMAIRTIDPSQGIIIAAFAYQSAEEVFRPPELMHIPLLIDFSIFQLRSLLEKIEVDRAIKALTSSELLRLQKFAKFRLRGLGRAARGRDWEDLLEEALYRTLIGAQDAQNGRHWNKKVNFVQHLAWVISSIANVWKRQFKEKDTYLISELLIHDAEGQEYSPLDNVAATHASADQHLIEKGEQERVLGIFKDDPEATQLLHGLMDGLKKNEIMSIYGLDEKRYVAAQRRIRLELVGERNNAGQRQDK